MAQLYEHGDVHVMKSALESVNTVFLYNLPVNLLKRGLKSISL